MKKIIFLLILAAVSMPAVADKYVSGYTRANGTYVQPYHRTDANNTKNDNYSTKGNVNPYTGRNGHEPNDSNILLPIQNQHN